MIRVEFLQNIAGIPQGTVKEFEDNHSGLVRAQVAAGKMRVIEREKIEKLPSKTPEKVETKQAPKTIKKKMK